MALKTFITRGTEPRTERQGGTAAEPPPPRAVMPEARPPRTVAPSTSIDASSELEGRLRCKETLRIDGRIQGEVECEKAVLVGQGARVRASISADEVQVSGRVEGDIVARRKITLERTAVVVGDLSTPGIVIEEGAKLKGRIVIGSDADVALEAECEHGEENPGDKEKRVQSARKQRPAAGPKPDEAPVPAPVAASA